MDFTYGTLQDLQNLTADLIEAAVEKYNRYSDIIEGSSEFTLPWHEAPITADAAHWANPTSFLEEGAVILMEIDVDGARVFNEVPVAVLTGERGDAEWALDRITKLRRDAKQRADAEEHFEREQYERLRLKYGRDDDEDE